MKRAMKLVLLLIFVVMFAAGCASFQKAASQVTPEQQAQMNQQIAPATSLIPQPYQIPATALAGWLACVFWNMGKNWWDNKTNPKA